MTDLASPLYVELAGSWEELWCTLSGPNISCFDKVDDLSPCTSSNCGDVVLELSLEVNSTTAKVTTIPLSALSKLLRTSKLPETPYFFNITISGNQYKFASSKEGDRSRWVKAVKDFSVSVNYIIKPISLNNAQTTIKSPDVSSFPKPKFGDDSLAASYDKFKKEYKYGENKLHRTKSKTPDDREVQDAGVREGLDGTAEAANEEVNEASPAIGKKDMVAINATPTTYLVCGCIPVSKFWHRMLKQETLTRLFKVATAFPFVIVVASLNLTGSLAPLVKSDIIIRTMNILVYVLPIILVKFLLSQFDIVWLHDITIGLYLLLYLLPVGFVVSKKLSVSTATNKIEEGTFCFKPARSVRCTESNFYAMVGFLFEWVQHCVYVLPLGVVTSATKPTLLSDYPPYLPFDVYFWVSVGSTFLCALIVVLNAVLKGKIHYKFQKSGMIWYILFNIGSPMFVTIVTILFMGLCCDFSTTPATLVQNPHLECYSSQHIVMAQAALMALAIYIVQHTLLPSGTFKETMGNNDLEIMFVPVYLQAHFLLKALFCGVYVFFYQNNTVRVTALTVINILLLCLNNFMKPCSVEWVNVLRDTFFTHATFSGIQSINYLVWGQHDPSTSLKGLVISTLASNVLFATIAMYVYYKYTFRSTEFTIAKAFLELEWQVSRGGSVHPRVLEPLISLTLSPHEQDWEIAEKYIGQLVWLISYPNIRVQFQSAWGLANLATLTENARLKIHEAGGTKALFEWYTDMDFVVQLEALAAMANLTLSYEVTEEMVNRYKCIPFFMNLVSSTKLKHSHFATIALGNIARNEGCRDLIRRAGGVQTLVGCVMSHDYLKRRYGCMALANMALSPAPEIVQVFESRGLLDRIIKMAARKEIETQREVVALIRNLSCHGRLRPLLLDRGALEAIHACQGSVYPEVTEWCAEILSLMDREDSFTGSQDLKSLRKREQNRKLVVGETDLEALRKMQPLDGMVEWSTWGSKLETIFSFVFSTVPTVNGCSLTTKLGVPVQVSLSNGIPAAMLQKWKAKMKFVISEPPVHGKLSALNADSHVVQYTPDDGYAGSDFFTFRLKLGPSITSPATVAIVIQNTDTAMEEGTLQTGASSSATATATAASRDGRLPIPASSSASPSQQSARKAAFPRAAVSAAVSSGSSPRSPMGITKSPGRAMYKRANPLSPTNA